MAMIWLSGIRSLDRKVSPLPMGDGDGDVDGADFLTWQRNFTPPSIPLAAMSDESANGIDQNIYGESQTAILAANPLTAELVDAALAMDQALRSLEELRLGSPALLEDDDLNWLSHQTQWSVQSAWQDPSTIANTTSRDQAKEPDSKRFHHDPAEETALETLLDELFAEVELGSIE